MSRHLTASDRKSLIRLASSLPKGSEERRAILAGLKTAGLLPSERFAKTILLKLLEETGTGDTQQRSVWAEASSDLLTGQAHGSEERRAILAGLRSAGILPYGTIISLKGPATLSYSKPNWPTSGHDLKVSAGDRLFIVSHHGRDLKVLPTGKLDSRGRPPANAAEYWISERDLPAYEVVGDLPADSLSEISEELQSLGLEDVSVGVSAGTPVVHFTVPVRLLPTWATEKKRGASGTAEFLRGAGSLKIQFPVTDPSTGRSMVRKYTFKRVGDLGRLLKNVGRSKEPNFLVRKRREGELIPILKGFKGVSYRAFVDGWNVFILDQGAPQIAEEMIRALSRNGFSAELVETGSYMNIPKVTLAIPWP